MNRVQLFAIGRSEYDFETPAAAVVGAVAEPVVGRHGVAIREALAQTGIDGDAVAGIGLTGQMHGLVLLDEGGHVLRPSILWNDQRTQAECDEIRERVGPSELISITGNDALTGFTAPKILWVRNNEPGSLLVWPMCCCRRTTFATGSRTPTPSIVQAARARSCSISLPAIGRLKWLTALDIPMGWLPPTFEGPT